MHGLILAGGEGSRLAASGVDTPKPLVPVAGVPQLLRLARTLERLGPTSLTCLLREGIALDPIADDLSRLPIPIAVRYCRTPSSLHTLVEGFSVVPPGSVFVTMVDTVMPARDWTLAYHAIARALADGADAIVAVTPFVDDERPLYVAHNARGHITAIANAPLDPVLVTGGVYGFGPRTRATAAALLTTGTSRMRGLLRSIVEMHHDVRAVEIARIIDLDRHHDLEAANAWQEFCEGESPATG